MTSKTSSRNIKTALKNTLNFLPCQWRLDYDDYIPSSGKISPRPKKVVSWAWY